MNVFPDTKTSIKVYITMEIAHSIDNKHVHIFLCSVCKNKINIADLAPVKRKPMTVFLVCVSQIIRQRKE